MIRGYFVYALLCGLALLPAAGPARAASGGEPLRPLVAIAGLDPGKVALGRRLFSDPILSADGTIACQSCHDLKSGGSDHRPHSIGIHGRQGALRAPTVFNAALNVAQFWDGLAATLEDQVAGPVTNPVEMGAQWPALLRRLGRDPVYDAAFRRLYGHGPDQAAVADAIATFERSLITVGSRFDAYLGGDGNALSADERKGYALFKSYGCASCHQGANVGGNMYQKFGILGDYWQHRTRIGKADLGRYTVTGLERDRYVFKVPSLRLAVVNGPYFHDGSVASLEEAIRLMGRYQLGQTIPDGDIHLIVDFLGSLVGDMSAAEGK